MLTGAAQESDDLLCKGDYTCLFKPPHLPLPVHVFERSTREYQGQLATPMAKVSASDLTALHILDLAAGDTVDARD